MATSNRVRRLIIVAVVVGAVVAWLLAGEFFWRNPRLANDSEDAIVQPAGIPASPAENR